MAQWKKHTNDHYKPAIHSKVVKVKELEKEHETSDSTFMQGLFNFDNEERVSQISDKEQEKLLDERIQQQRRFIRKIDSQQHAKVWLDSGTFFIDDKSLTKIGETPSKHHQF